MGEAAELGSTAPNPTFPPPIDNTNTATLTTFRPPPTAPHTCPAHTHAPPHCSLRWAAWSACLRLGASSAMRASPRGTTPSSPPSSSTRCCAALRAAARRRGRPAVCRAAVLCLTAGLHCGLPFAVCPWSSHSILHLVQAYADYNDMMDLTEDIIRQCAQVGTRRAVWCRGACGACACVWRGGARGLERQGGGRDNVAVAGVHARPEVLARGAAQSHREARRCHAPSARCCAVLRCRRCWARCGCPTRAWSLTLRAPSGGQPCTNWSRRPLVSQWLRAYHCSCVSAALACTGNGAWSSVSLRPVC